MSDDVLDFLDDSGSTTTVVDAPATVAPVEDTSLSSTTVTTEDPTPKVEPVPEVPPVAPVVSAPVSEAPKEEPKTVPLATFLDVLKENKDLKKGKEAPAAPEPEFVVPDPVKQPAEYAAYQETMFQFNLMNERMNNSEKFARKEHGNELIDKVRDYATTRMDTDPQFANLVTTSADPYEEAVKAYREAEELKEYRTWVANGKKPLEQPGTPPVAQPTPQSQPAPVLVAPVAKPQPVVEPLPGSIVDQPSSGGITAVPTGPGTAFDDTFGGPQT